MTHIANLTGAKGLKEFSRLLAGATLYIFQLAIQILGDFTQGGTWREARRNCRRVDSLERADAI